MATIDQVRGALGDLRKYLDSIDVAATGMPDPLLTGALHGATVGVQTTVVRLLQRSYQDPAHFDNPVILNSLSAVGRDLQQAEGEIPQRPREVVRHVLELDRWAATLHGDSTTKPPRW